MRWLLNALTDLDVYTVCDERGLNCLNAEDIRKAFPFETVREASARFAASPAANNQ